MLAHLVLAGNYGTEKNKVPVTLSHIVVFVYQLM